MPSVPALLGPSLNNFPIRSEVRILASLFETRFIKTRNLDQFPQSVRMAGFHLFSVWEFTPLGSFSDASLERTLHRIAGQIIGAIEQSQLQQGGRLLQSDPRKLLEVFSVHEHSSYRLEAPKSVPRWDTRRWTPLSYRANPDAPERIGRVSRVV